MSGVWAALWAADKADEIAGRASFRRIGGYDLRTASNRVQLTLDLPLPPGQGAVRFQGYEAAGTVYLCAAVYERERADFLCRALRGQGWATEATTIDGSPWVAASHAAPAPEAGR